MVHKGHFTGWNSFPTPGISLVVDAIKQNRTTQATFQIIDVFFRCSDISKLPSEVIKKKIKSGSEDDSSRDK